MATIGPALDGAPQLFSVGFDLAAVGYSTHEHFVTGTASAYADVRPRDPNGEWDVTPTRTADFTTRLVVYRPADPARSNGTVMVGFSQFASNQHPSAGYAMHLAGDGAGTIRDALIDHPGEDYYHKTFATATGRNRWGDYSKAQVDPVDDQTLWTVNEYAKARTGTDDGNTGGNSSKWSTWWAAVAGSAPTVTIDPGPVQNEGNAGTSIFAFTARLSAAWA